MIDSGPQERHAVQQTDRYGAWGRVYFKCACGAVPSGTENIDSTFRLG